MRIVLLIVLMLIASTVSSEEIPTWNELEKSLNCINEWHERRIYEQGFNDGLSCSYRLIAEKMDIDGCYEEKWSRFKRLINDTKEKGSQ